MQNNRPEEWNQMLEEWKIATKKIQTNLANFGLPLKEFLAKKGCEPLEPGQQAHDSPHLNLYMYPKDLDYHQDDDLFEMQPRWFRFDSLMRKQTLNLNEPKYNYWTEKIKSLSKDKEAIIYFSLGSIASGDHRLLKEYVRIFANDQKRLYIISKGVHGDKFDLDERNMIGGNFIPQTFLLQHANLVIIHGGNNTVTESLYYGLPMIIMPVFADQYDNAQRVEDLKLGQRLNPYELDEGKLMRAINDILSNKKIVERCQEIGKQMRARDDAKKATLLLKKLIDDGRLEQSFIDDCRDKDADEINW